MNPTKVPESTARIIAKPRGMKLMNLIARIPETTRIPPIERSQPPEIMVKVTPNDKMRRIDVELSISKRL
jgi:hypothetical protein